MSGPKRQSPQGKVNHTGRLLGITELADLLGLDKGTVSEACKKGMPRTSLEEALAWRSERPLVQARANSGTIGEARLAKLNAETERIKFKTAVEQGAYIPADQVQDAATSIGSVLVAELSALANDLPGQLAGLSEVQIRDRLLARLDGLIASTREKLQNLKNVRTEGQAELGD